MRLHLYSTLTFLLIITSPFTLHAQSNQSVDNTISVSTALIHDHIRSITQIFAGGKTSDLKDFMKTYADKKTTFKFIGQVVDADGKKEKIDVSITPKNLKKYKKISEYLNGDLSIGRSRVTLDAASGFGSFTLSSFGFGEVDAPALEDSDLSVSGHKTSCKFTVARNRAKILIFNSMTCTINARRSE